MTRFDIIKVYLTDHYNANTPLIRWLLILTLALHANAAALPATAVSPDITSDEQTVIEEVVEKSIYEKVVDEFGADHIMVRIAKAESSFINQPNWKYTGEDGYYTAYGVFMFTRTTYAAYCGDPSERLNVDSNIKCARVVYERNGTRDWNESKHNW